jgi:hypothetical protein
MHAISRSVQENEHSVDERSYGVARLFGFWTFAAVALGGCAARGTDAQKTVGALIIAAIAGVFIAMLVAVAIWVSRRKWGLSYRGAFIGVVFGLVISAVIIRRVPLETQLLAIGAILGFGTDLLTSLKDPGGPKTAINRLATMIAGIITETGKAAQTSGLAKPREQIIAGGLWAFLATILFTLAIGNLF